MDRKQKKVKLTNKETGEVNIFTTTLEAAKAINYKYITVNAWLNGRIESPKYIAEYVYDI